ncbi:DnaJ domain-containing protein [Pendulispora rubella]|uniref:DnaJ domain-containing protein n=1 Tax=Pendulispora rubella TaxID=2741070 RepID=A0ABZ2KY83_9BACT
MADDLYTVLGVPKGADTDTIKKAYRKLAQKLHPDKNPGNKQIEARFKAVNNAYNVLSDDSKRKLYDEFGEEGLREGFDPNRVRAYKQWASQQGARGGGGGHGGAWTNSEGVRIEDLFGGIGGNSAAGVGDVFGDLFGRSRRQPRGPMKGQDLESQVTIDFVSAINGATMDLRTDGGRAVTVRIPPGADEGSRVRIPGQGGPSPNGGPPGDLVLVVHVLEHPFFKREGDDLHVNVPITLKEAYQGAKVRVPTPDGFVSLRVPEGTQSGNVVRARGKGVARKGRTPGDLYVHFLVRIPQDRSPETAALIDQLGEKDTSDPREELRF